MQGKEDMKKSSRATNSKPGQMDSLHVTFAEHTDQYVINSDSGIFLANDDVTADAPAVDRSTCEKIPPNKPVRPILKLQKCVSVESQDNPFLRDGELMRKADYIINNSTISRKRIRIADPDLAPKPEVPHSAPAQLSTAVFGNQATPEVESGEIVKIGGVTRMSKDDLVVMDICSSDSNRDQSSLEDVRSLNTIDRSPVHPRPRHESSPSDAHERLLVPSEEEMVTDQLETSKSLLPPHNFRTQTAQPSQSSAQKLNGENLTTHRTRSPELSTGSKTGATSRTRKKKKCCLLQ